MHACAQCACLLPYISNFLLTVTMVNCCKRSVEEPQPFVDSKHRHCTDLPCCLAFLIFWLGMVIIAIVGLAYGRPESLVYGTDYQGSTCGSSGTAGSFIYYPKLTEDLAAAAASGQTDITSMSFFGMCMDACPSMGDVVCTTDGKVALAQYVTRSGRRVPRLLERAWLTSLLTSSLEHYYYCQSPICWRYLTRQLGYSRQRTAHSRVSRPVARRKLLSPF